MKKTLGYLLIQISQQACLSAEDLIKGNEAPVNFMPGDSRSVCWGCNSGDLQKYLGIDYDHYAKNDLTLTVEECDTMFNAKLEYTIQEVDRLMIDDTSKICECAYAALIDVAYDATPMQIEYDFRQYANYLMSFIYHMAVESLSDTFWCYNNTSRCSNDIS